jgi:hypothetical protein
MSGSLCTCPDCHATLKLAPNRPSGKPIECPKCNSVFTIPEVEEVPEMEALPPQPPLSPRGAGEGSVSGRVVRRRAWPTDEEAERRPRRSTRPVSTGISPATVALIVVPVLLGGLLLAGGAWLVWRALNPKSEVVAGTSAAGGANPRGPNGAVRSGPVNPQAPLNVARGTQVGALALEIEGEDIDGKRFRLSDYQGKVVLLDFWGNW